MIAHCLMDLQCDFYHLLNLWIWIGFTFLIHSSFIYLCISLLITAMASSTCSVLVSGYWVSLWACFFFFFYILGVVYSLVFIVLPLICSNNTYWTSAMCQTLFEVLRVYKGTKEKTQKSFGHFLIIFGVITYFYLSNTLLFPPNMLLLKLPILNFNEF
jgi:hypothetical protein